MQETTAVSGDTGTFLAIKNYLVGARHPGPGQAQPCDARRDHYQDQEDLCNATAMPEGVQAAGGDGPDPQTIGSEPVPLEGSQGGEDAGPRGGQQGDAEGSCTALRGGVGGWRREWRPRYRVVRAGGRPRPGRAAAGRVQFDLGRRAG